MKAKEYLQNAICNGITKPVYFRGFYECWESVLMTIQQAISLLDTEFSDIADIEISVSQSGIDENFPDYMVVYFYN